jgi:hypothetical protein
MTDTDTKKTLDDRVREALRLLRDLPGDLETEDDPAFTTEQVNFLEKRLYEVRAVLEGDNRSLTCGDAPLDARELLAKHRMIGVVWCIDDVKNVRPHLTDDQAWHVLQQVGDTHDAEWGITWTTLETVADDMFPMGQQDGGTHEA